MSDRVDLDACLARLGDEDAAIRLEAQVALLAYGEAIVPALATLLAGPDVIARREAAWLLAHLLEGAAPAREALVEAASDEDAEVRRLAAAAVRRIDDPASAEAEIMQTLARLMAHLDDDSEPADGLGDGNAGTQ